MRAYAAAHTRQITCTALLSGEHVAVLKIRFRICAQGTGPRLASMVAVLDEPAMSAEATEAAEAAAVARGGGFGLAVGGRLDDEDLKRIKAFALAFARCWVD